MQLRSNLDSVRVIPRTVSEKLYPVDVFRKSIPEWPATEACNDGTLQWWKRT